MTEIIHKRGRGEPDPSAFSEPGELAIDIETGEVYTLTEHNTVVCVGPKKVKNNGPRHTLYCKAKYTTGSSVGKDQFQALQADMTPYHAIGPYTYGFIIGQNFGQDDTTALEWDRGCHLEMYSHEGNLLYAVEVDHLEHNADGTMTLSWDRSSAMYEHNLWASDGMPYYIKMANLGGIIKYFADTQRRSPPDEV